MLGLITKHVAKIIDYLAWKDLYLHFIAHLPNGKSHVWMYHKIHNVASLAEVFSNHKSNLQLLVCV